MVCEFLKQLSFEEKMFFTLWKVFEEEQNRLIKFNSINKKKLHALPGESLAPSRRGKEMPEDT